MTTKTSSVKSNSARDKHCHKHRRRNEQWPTAHELPRARTIPGRFWRRFLLGGLYFFWVCGLALFAGMWGYTLVSIARAVLTRNAVSVPLSVSVFLACIAAYESYRHLVPLVPWLPLRHFVRHKLAHYPYFRFNTCVFEHELLAAASDAGALDATAEPETETEPLEAATTSPSDLSYTFTQPLEPDNKSLYAFHPHGILTCGMALNGAHHLRFANTNARWLVAENLFWFPVLRDLLKWLEFDNVSKRTFVDLMARGQNIGFIPGGFEEATLFEHGKHRVFLAKRYGFIKLALQHGYKIYPAYTFGEEQTYHAFPYLLKLRLKLNELKIPAAIFVGNLFCFFMPRSDVDLITVVGTPLELPTIADPTPEDVQKYHAMYVQKLQTLFDKHKAMYASDPHATLEIY